MQFQEDKTKKLIITRMKAWCAMRTALSSDLQKKINDSQPFSCCHVASMMHSYQALGPACAFMTFDRTAGLGSSLRSLLLSLCACVCLLAVVALGLCLSVVCVVLCFLGAFCIAPWSSQGVWEVKQKKRHFGFSAFTLRNIIANPGQVVEQHVKECLFERSVVARSHQEML